MPRTKICRNLEDERLLRLKQVFELYREMRGYKSWKDVALDCGMNPGTLYQRLRDMGELREREKHKLTTFLKIPDEEIRPYL